MKSLRLWWALLAAAALLPMAGCTGGLDAEPAAEQVHLNWLTSYDQAQAQAKADGKLLLMDFTGSDWCGWCIKLNREVFSTQAFKNYADSNLVLLEVDFPMHKEQTAAQKEANEALQTKYGIRGYPTIIVLNPKGEKVGELGYQRGGPKPFIAALEKLKGK